MVRAAQANHRINHEARRMPVTLARLCMLSLAVLMGAVGCKSDDLAFDPSRLEQMERERSRATTKPVLETLPPTTQESPRVPRNEARIPVVPTTGPSVGLEQSLRLSLQEIIQRAVANSSEVRVAGYDPAINEVRVMEARARFDPAFILNTRYEKTDMATAGTLERFSSLFDPITRNFDKTEVFTVETGIEQLLLSGGQARLVYQAIKSDFDPKRFEQNPFWESALKFEITQPLLRDFGTQVNSARILIARNDQRISVLEFRRVLEDNLSEIERAYWQLHQSERTVRIQELLLLRSLRTYTTLKDRFDAGIDPSPIPYRQAEGEVHSRKSDLIEAKRAVRDLSAEIKRRMNDPELPVGGPLVILPADEPLSKPINFDYGAQVAAAMDNRLELGQQLIRIDSAGIAQGVAKNAMRPRLDLVGSAGFNGVDDNFGGAFDENLDFNQLAYSIGLNFQFPIGNREARAVYRRAQLQRMQAVEQYRNLVAQVSLDVEQSMNQIWSSWERVISRNSARLSNEERLRLLQEREDILAQLTPEFVNLKLQAEQDLAIAQREEVAAIADYNIAIQRLERSKGTLLRYNNVIMDEEKFIPR